MILPDSPDNPILVRVATATILILHIGSGVTGLASGAVALASRKGGRLHRRAGALFVVAMLIMSGIGAAVAPFLPQRSSVVPGLFTFYLVATGWMAVKRPAGGIGRFDIAAFLFAVAAFVIGVGFAIQAAASASGELDGDPPAIFLVFSGLVALAAALDLRRVLSRGLSGAARLARHIWRVSVALLIAAFSFFIGQPKVFPPALRGSMVMFLPEVAVLGLMIFWLLRVRRRDQASLIGAVATPRRESASPT
jgi:uncharacterized membrane protein